MPSKTFVMLKKNFLITLSFTIFYIKADNGNGSNNSNSININNINKTNHNNLGQLIT